MQEHLCFESFYLILAAIKQNDGLVVFVNGSNILRARLSHEKKHLILLGKVVYEVTRDQAAGLV